MRFHQKCERYRARAPANSSLAPSLHNKVEGCWRMISSLVTSLPLIREKKCISASEKSRANSAVFIRFYHNVGTVSVKDVCIFSLNLFVITSKSAYLTRLWMASIRNSVIAIPIILHPNWFARSANPNVNMFSVP